MLMIQILLFRQVLPIGEVLQAGACRWFTRLVGFEFFGDAVDGEVLAGFQEKYLFKAVEEFFAHVAFESIVVLMLNVDDEFEAVFEGWLGQGHYILNVDRPLQLYKQLTGRKRLTAIFDVAQLVSSEHQDSFLFLIVFVELEDMARPNNCFLCFQLLHKDFILSEIQWIPSNWEHIDVSGFLEICASHRVRHFGVLLFGGLVAHTIF